MKPDKGKTENLLSDRTKFKVIDGDWFREVLKFEDKTNRFLSKLLKNKIIDRYLYEHLFISSSRPGILYGLPKVHKPNCPIRPILSAIGTSGYKLAKYLLKFLAPLTTNIYSVKDSFDFVNDIRKIPNSNSLVMASFDISSLFTNIPLNEVIDISADSLYDTLNTPVLGMSKLNFTQFLSLAVKDALFIFNEKLYCQKDGIGMGNPLGPTLANVFLCFHEQRWLDNCPSEFKPVFYKRYIF